MNLRPSWLAASAAAVLLSACAGQTPPPSKPVAEAPPAPPAPVPPPKPKPQYGAFGFDAAGMDPAVAPGDDFYRYANGTWDKTTTIPSDRSTYNTFAVLAEIAAKRTQDIIQAQADAKAPEGSEARKIGDYYASFMDEGRIEQLGAAPLQPELSRIRAIHDRKSLSTYLGSTLRADVDVLNATSLHTDRLFGLWVVEDLNDTSRYEPYLLQGGLGMPNRDYYLSDSPKFAEIRAKYLQHLAKMLTLAGLPDAESRAKRVLALERPSPRRIGPRPTPPTSPRRTPAGARPTSPGRRRASTGRRSSRPRGCRPSRSSAPGRRAPSPASRGKPRAHRSRSGRTT